MKHIRTKKSDCDIENSFKKYIKKVVENTRKDYDRKKNRLTKYEMVVSFEEEYGFDNLNNAAVCEDFSDDLVSSYKEIENCISSDRLFVAIKELPSRLKKILYFKYIEDKTDEEIAQELGIKRQAVTKARNAALRMIMKKYLQ